MHAPVATLQVVHVSHASHTLDPTFAYVFTTKQSAHAVVPAEYFPTPH